MNFIDKKVSAKQVIAILARNGIQVDGKEATIILDFLYLIAKNYKRPEEAQNAKTLTRNRTFGKTL
jgi:hypothetical protein